MLNVVYSEFLRNNQQNLKLSFILSSTNSKTERSSNMPKNKRRLVVVKMPPRIQCGNINQLDREKMEETFRCINEAIRGSKAMIIAQNSPWTIEVAQIAHVACNTFVFEVVDVFRTVTARDVKSLKGLIKLLNQHAKKFNTLIVITHGDDLITVPIISDLFLGLSDQPIETVPVCGLEIVEYGYEN